MTVTRDVVLRLWPVASACPDARHAIREFCRARGLNHLVDSAELLTSELVTNAIRHTSTLITVVGTQHDDVLVVGVTGEGPTDRELVAQHPERLADAGRGLFVVDQVADEWGASRHTNGNTVWFRLC